MTKAIWILFFLITACGYNSTDLNEKTIGLASADGQLNFATIQAQVFQPHCVRCHGSSGGVTLTNYASVRLVLNRIQSAVNSGAMPPSGSLPTTTKNLLNQWIAAGAPEAGTGTGTGTGAGAGTGATGGTGGGDCEDDRRLIGTSLLVEVGPDRVYDTENEVIRNFNNGCNDDR